MTLFQQAPFEVRAISYIIRTMDKAQARNATVTKIIDIIFTALNLRHVDRNTVTEQTPLTQGGLNLDSIDILELIINFEHSFGIKLNESEAYAQHFKDVGSIATFVESQKTS